jgi:predicted nucleotidyltransferase
MHSDFKELLKIFNDYQIKYLVIGGYAVMQYTEPRYTKDLDLWIRADQENAAAVFQALQAFGAPLVGMTEDDFAHEGYFYQIGVPPVRVDILMSIPGVTFQQAWAKRVEADVAGVKVFFISREDLIISKQATGRAQDLIDAELLSLPDTVAAQTGLGRSSKEDDEKADNEGEIE